MQFDPSSVPSIDASSPTVDVVAWAKALDLPADLVGRWVWVFFTDKPSPAVRDALKAAGFRFSRAHDGRPAGWFHTGGNNRGRRRPVKGCDARTIHGQIPVRELEIG